MAIKIPSSKIYDNQHTLYKNFIDKVDAKESYLDFKKTFDTSVLSYSQDFSELEEPIFSEETKTGTHNVNNGVGMVYYVNAKLTTLDDYISEKKTSSDGKKKILNVKSEEIQHSYSGLLRRKEYVFSSYGDNMPSTNTFVPPSEDELLTISTPAEPRETDIESIPFNYGFVDGTAASAANVNFGDLERIWTQDGDDIVGVEITSKRVALSGTKASGQLKNDGKYYWQVVTFEEYIPKSYTLTVTGDIEEYENKNSTKTFGDGSDYYEMPSNELFQATTKLKGIPITEVNANSLVKDFRNGKETYELLCSVKEYYNEDGTLAISTKGQVGGKTKMLFDIGDEVIPYKPTAAGDKPISYKKDGKTPKTFIVVGVTPIFDGAVWQRLNLVEKSSGYEFLFPEVEETVVTGCSGLILVNTDKTATYTLEGVKRVMYGDKLIEEVTYIDSGDSVWRIASFSYDSSTKTGTLTLTTSSIVSNLDGLNTVTTPYVPAKEYEFFVLK